MRTKDVLVIAFLLYLASYHYGTNTNVSYGDVIPDVPPSEPIDTSNT